MTDVINIEYRNGDATLPVGSGPKVIAHVCNDIGGWGKGFVLTISRRWKAPETAYRQWFKDRAQNDFELGALQIVEVEPDLYVANMVGQRNIISQRTKPPVRYEAIRICLEKLASETEIIGASIHMPRIGCGLAGGKWEIMEPIINETLVAKNISVTVYDHP